MEDTIAYYLPTSGYSAVLIFKLDDVHYLVMDDYEGGFMVPLNISALAFTELMKTVQHDGRKLSESDVERLRFKIDNPKSKAYEWS